MAVRLLVVLGLVARLADGKSVLRQMRKIRMIVGVHGSGQGVVPVSRPVEIRQGGRFDEWNVLPIIMRVSG